MFQIDVGKLISDLDDDIRASEMVGSRENSPPRPSPNHAPPRPPPSFSQEENDKGLKMKIKRTKSGRQEIVKAEGGAAAAAFNGNFENELGKTGSSRGPSPTPGSQGPMMGTGLPINRPVSMGGPAAGSNGPNSGGNGPPSSGPSGPSSSVSGGSSGGSGPPSSGESGPPSPQIKSEYTAVSGRNGGGGQPHLTPLTPAGLQQLTTAKLKVGSTFLSFENSYITLSSIFITEIQCISTLYFGREL